MCTNQNVSTFCWLSLIISCFIFSESSRAFAALADFIIDPELIPKTSLLNSISPASSVLEVRTDISPQDKRILLSDIFYCYGRTQNCERFFGLDIGKKPAPGETITLYKKDILDILGREQIHLPIEFEGTFPLKITTPFLLLETEFITQALKNHLDTLQSDADVAAKVEIASLTLSRQLKLPADQPVTLVFPDLVVGEDLAKIFKPRKLQTRITVNAVVDGVFEGVTSVYASYRVWQKHPIANRDISIDDEVTERDINYEWRQAKMGNLIPLSFDKNNNQDSWVAKKVIPKGQSIFLGQVERPIWVPSQSDVDILIKSGSVEVKAKGKALKNGSKGDQIFVEMLGKRKRILARVIDIGLVEVEM